MQLRSCTLMYTSVQYIHNYAMHIYKLVRNTVSPVQSYSAAVQFRKSDN